MQMAANRGSIHGLFCDSQDFYKQIGQGK